MMFNKDRLPILISLPWDYVRETVTRVLVWMWAGVLGGSGCGNLLALSDLYTPFFLYSSNLEGFCGFLPPVVVTG